MMTARPHRRLTVAASLAVVALAALAGGCSFSRPALVKQVYLVEPPTPPVAAATRPATLQVRAVGVAAPFRGRTFVYRQTDLRYESDFYTEFLVAPSAMLADGTARALERARVFARVVPPGSSSEGDFLLDGFFDAFYVDLRDPGKPAAEAAATYFLSRGDPAAPVPFWSKQYRQRVPVNGSGTDAYAAALSAAFGAIATELAADLAAVDLPKP
jgi:cholesterol transport system auxiliary component